MKVLSFYLPQFHEIPENNDAWGNGFTEWTNVKKAKPLFYGHNQPRIPLNNNYYNLLNKRTMKWQSELASSYGIDGFCFYHYWFHGRLVLEKPVELLRKMPELNIHFCFAWANEPWTKTWHGAGGQKEILIPQTYGKEEEWEKHYQYFSIYFKDDRYIKEDNRPMVLIYKLSHIPYYNDMIRYWNKRAMDDGFSGIFLLSMNTGQNQVSASKWVNGTVDFEPNNTKSKMLIEPIKKIKINKSKNCLWNRFATKTISYSKINNKMLSILHGQNAFRTVFVDYDDTPRRKENGIVTIGSKPYKFRRFLEKNLLLSKQEGNNYIFMNAWNEWGEGNYLEPDNKNGYCYLKSVRDVRKKRNI